MYSTHVCTVGGSHTPSRATKNLSSRGHVKTLRLSLLTRTLLAVLGKEVAVIAFVFSYQLDGFNATKMWLTNAQVLCFMRVTVLVGRDTDLT